MTAVSMQAGRTSELAVAHAECRLKQVALAGAGNEVIVSQGMTASDRESRPLGFDMSYRPRGKEAYGPPLSAWTMPSIYFLVALVFVGIVVAAPYQSPDTWLYRYVVESDIKRAITSRTIAVLFGLGGVSAMMRTAMRGVTIHPDGIAYRDVLTLGWPKVRDFSWAEIDEIIIERSSMALRLWTGAVQRLPSVRDHEGLRDAMERVGVARAIKLRGAGLRPIDDVRAELEELREASLDA